MLNLLFLILCLLAGGGHPVYESLQICPDASYRAIRWFDIDQIAQLPGKDFQRIQSGILNRFMPETTYPDGIGDPVNITIVTTVSAPELESPEENTITKDWTFAGGEIALIRVIAPQPYIAKLVSDAHISTDSDSSDMFPVYSFHSRFEDSPSNTYVSLLPDGTILSTSDRNNLKPFFETVLGLRTALVENPQFALLEGFLPDASLSASLLIRLSEGAQPEVRSWKLAAAARRGEEREEWLKNYLLSQPLYTIQYTQTADDILEDWIIYLFESEDSAQTFARQLQASITGRGDQNDTQKATSKYMNIIASRLEITQEDIAVYATTYRDPDTLKLQRRMAKEREDVKEAKKEGEQTPY